MLFSTIQQLIQSTLLAAHMAAHRGGGRILANADDHRGTGRLAAMRNAQNIGSCLWLGFITTRTNGYPTFSC